MIENKNNIDYRFKILYAVAIIMVVCGHAQGGGINIMHDWFPYGGMQLAIFVFCSGYFYKSESENNVWKYICKKIKTLIIPLYLYTLVYGLIVLFLKNYGFGIGGDFTLYNILIAPLTDGHQFIYNLGGWFVTPLFMVEVYNILIRRVLKVFLKNVHESVFLFIALAIGIFGNQLACQGYNNGLWLVLVRMLYFVPFYEIGVFYKKCLEKYDKKIPSFWYFAAIFAIKLRIILYYGKVPIYTPSWCNDFYEGPFMPIVIGVLGIALWMRIATILEPVIGRSKWINLIADNTYSIMMNQFLGFMLVKTMYAFVSKVYSGIEFDWYSYKNDIWWFYEFRGIGHTLILYVVAGIAFPIVIQLLINWIKKWLQTLHMNKDYSFVFREK